MSGFTSLGKKSLGGGAGGGSGLNANSVGPFGTSLVSEMSATAQGAFTFGLNTSIWSATVSGAVADALVSDGVVTLTSGNETDSSSTVRLSRGIRYRAGQGTMVRLTAIFQTPGQDDTLQMAGMGNRESGYFFAMSGSNFGIMHREKSSLEVRKFAVTSAPAGAATLTVNLAGNSVSVPVNGDSSTSQTAYQITVSGSFNNAGSGWIAEAHGSNVYFASLIPGPYSGTFSLLNVATPIATVTTATAGVLPTQTFIPQTSWNIDPMNGTGDSRFTLDVSKGNVYGIGLQYLGYGNAFFSVEDPETGLLTPCHMIRNTNARTSPVVKDPHMTAMWQAVNSGSLAQNVTVKGVSAANFVEGKILRSIGPSFSVSSERTGVNDVENVLTPLLTIRANVIHKGRVCFSEIDPFNLTVGSDTGNASSTTLLSVYVYKNADLGGPVSFTEVDSNRSICSYDTSATSITVTSRTQLIKSMVVAANESAVVDLMNDDFYLCSGETLTIAAKCNKNNSSDVITSLSWYEDQ